MSQELETRRMRLQFDCGSFNYATDRLTAGSPKIWKKNNLRIEIGAFLDIGNNDAPTEGKQIDVSEWDSLTLEVKDGAGTANVIAKTTSTFDGTLTAETWNNLTKAHAVIELTNAETNVTAGSYDGVVSVITNDGAKITLGVFKLEVKDSRATFPAEDAPESPGVGISLAEADARYALLTSSAFSVHRDGVDQTIPDGVPTKLQWTSGEFDEGGDFASHKFTPQIAGRYLFNLGVSWAAATTLNSFVLTIYKNGGEKARLAQMQLDGLEITMVSGSVYLTANGTTDYFEAYVLNLDSAPRDVLGPEGATYFQGVLQR